MKQNKQIINLNAKQRSNSKTKQRNGAKEFSIFSRKGLLVNCTDCSRCPYYSDCH